MSQLAIRGGLLVDGSDGIPRQNELIVVQGERIAYVGSARPFPRWTRVVAAAGLSILPGFVDLHVHFGAPVGEDLGRPRPLLYWEYARHRPRHRRDFLSAGVTTIRSVGDVVGFRRDILDLKRRSSSAAFRGPRVLTAGPLFTAPDGHPAGTIYRSNQFLLEHATRQVSSAKVARSEVSRLVAMGVDGIKAVYDSAGGALPRLSSEVLQAIIDQSHEHGVWVAVHTGSADEVREAVLAGADTIEHGAMDGSLLDSQTIALMHTRGTTYVPTLAAIEAMAELAAAGRRPEHFSPDAWLGFLRQMSRLGPEPLRSPMRNARSVAAAGVRVGTGTDAHGQSMRFGASLHREQELLVAAGLSAPQVLLATTSNAASAARVADLGRIVPGNLADLVIVAGRPWENIGEIRNIRLVIRAGRVVAARN